MSDLKTPRDLFIHELGDILYVEQKLADEVLPKLIKEVQSPELRKGLENHLKETRQHITNVEEVFEGIGEEPTMEECVGFQGLKKEHDQLVEESENELIDMIDASAVARTEHYEIAAYESLIILARALDEQNVIDLLETNLKQEKEALREVESIARQFSKEQVKEFTS